MPYFRSRRDSEAWEFTKRQLPKILSEISQRHVRSGLLSELVNLEEGTFECLYPGWMEIGNSPLT